MLTDQELAQYAAMSAYYDKHVAPLLEQIADLKAERARLRRQLL